MFVYLLTCLVNGKVYVGKTMTTVSRRWLNHVSVAKNPRTYISRAIAKYGAEAFTVETLCEAESESQLSFYECLFISALNSMNSTWGYNLTAGGEGTTGRKMSDAQRQKMSKDRTGKKLNRPQWNTGKKMPTSALVKMRKWMLANPVKHWEGKTLSDAHRKAISVGGTGVKRTPEQKARYSAALKGNPNVHSWLGKHHTKETKAKCSAVKKLWWAQRKLSQGQTP